MATKLSHQWNLFTIIRYGLALWVLFLSSTGKHLVPVHHHAYKSCCTITKVALTWHRDGCHSVVSQLLLGQQMPQLPRSRGQRIWERKTLVGYMYYLSEIQRNVNNKKNNDWHWSFLPLDIFWESTRTLVKLNLTFLILKVECCMFTCTFLAMSVGWQKQLVFALLIVEGACVGQINQENSKLFL